MRPKKKKASAVLLLTGALFVIVLGYYIAAGTWPGYTVMDWYKAMPTVLEKPFLPYYNSYTVKSILACLALYSFLVMMYLTSQRNYLPGREMGSSQYADVHKVNKKLADLSTNLNDPQNIVTIKKRKHFWKKVKRR